MLARGSSRSPGAHHRGRVLGELHESAYAGERDGARIPLRFLVAHRGQQPPVDLVLGGGLLEPVEVARQPCLHVLQEIAREQVVEASACRRSSGRAAARSVPSARTPTIERIDPVEQRPIVARGAYDPGDRPARARGRARWRVRGGPTRLSANSVELASVNSTSPADTPARISSVSVSAALDPGEVGVLQPQFLQRALVRAAHGHLDLAPAGLADRRRPRGAAPIHEVLADAMVARAEMGLRREVDPGGQSGRRDVGPTRGDLADRGLARADGVEPQGDAEVLGKPARELVGRALRAVAAEVVGVRAVARDDPQLARPRAPARAAPGGWLQVASSRVASSASRGFMSPFAIEYAAAGEVPKRS